MALLIGILAGFVLAFYASKRGFYAMWAVLVNAAIAIYLAVMLTPGMVELILGRNGQSPYAYAGFLVGITAIIFIVAQMLAFTFLTGTFDVMLPKIFDTLGGAVIGFFLGMIIWGLITFVLLIIPIPKSVSFLKDDLPRMTNVSVYRLCNIVNSLSRQDDEDTVRKMMDKTIRAGKKLPKPKTTDPNQPEDVNSVEPNIEKN
jgi:hypothetical protein